MTNRDWARATPGPWETDGVKITSKKLVYIAEVMSFATKIPYSPETEANARLIASCPELLDALEKCLDYIDGATPTGEKAVLVYPNGRGGVVYPQEIARSAIQKARGEG